MNYQQYNNKLRITTTLTKKVLDKPAKKRIMFSFIIYYPLISLLAGAPIPFPSIFNPSSEQIALLNFVSLLITLVGSIIGVGFYLEKRQNEKIRRIEEQIDEAVIATNEQFKATRMDMKEMERRLCETMISKNLDMEKATDLKVSKAKELADQKIQTIEDTQRDMRKDIQGMERGYFKSNRYTRTNRQDEVEDNNNGGNGS